MDDNKPKYFNDDGNGLNPVPTPKPDLCISCRKDGIRNEEILCDLTRMDQQGEDEFICDAYELKEED
jgi:hypothetical protein